jgi:hypothetical protein
VNLHHSVTWSSLWDGHLVDPQLVDTAEMVVPDYSHLLIPPDFTSGDDITARF